MTTIRIPVTMEIEQRDNVTQTRYVVDLDPAEILGDLAPAQPTPPILVADPSQPSGLRVDAPPVASVLVDKHCPVEALMRIITRVVIPDKCDPAMIANMNATSLRVTKDILAAIRRGEVPGIHCANGDGACVSEKFHNETVIKMNVRERALRAELAVAKARTMKDCVACIEHDPPVDADEARSLRALVDPVKVALANANADCFKTLQERDKALADLAALKMEYTGLERSCVSWMEAKKRATDDYEKCKANLAAEKKVYLDIADAVAPSTSGAADVIARIRAMRADLATMTKRADAAETSIMDLLRESREFATAPMQKRIDTLLAAQEKRS